MLQQLNGKTVYVVEFDTIPELPITGFIDEETRYNKILAKFGNCGCTLAALTKPRRDRSVYAEALEKAIVQGIITEGGKYAIHIDHATQQWSIFAVIE